MQGDVIGLLDSTGSQVVSCQHNSWGKLLTTTDTTAEKAGNQNPFRYRGYCWDEETGLYYVGNRYYDPETCRFISPDTVEVLGMSPMSLTDKNLYVYCDNNPVIRKDKEGQFWVTVGITVGIMFAGGLIGAAASAGCSMTMQIMTSGEVNWKSVGVAAGSGFVSGAIAASPLGLTGQVIAGALIGGATYAADCYVNDNPIRVDEMIVATIGGGVAGRIGGAGANEHLVLTNTIKTAMKTINRMAARNCVKYATKIIESTKVWRSNILSYAVLKGSLVFGIGCGISNGVLAVYQKGKSRVSPRCRSV